MKNRIMKNVNLDRGEVVQKEFRSLQAKNKFCSILVTDKRLIIYTIRTRIGERTVCQTAGHERNRLALDSPIRILL
jgi:hypothetical protein